MSCIPAGDTAAKIMVTEYGLSPLFVGWARFVGGAILVLPLAGRTVLPLMRDWRIWGRGVLMASGILSIMTALTTAPIASVFAAFFIGPIVSFALSALVLREEVTPLRAVFMGLGFAGVLLVVRPGFGMAEGLGFAVLAGCFYGCFLTASRAVTGLGRPMALLLSQLLVGVLLLAPVALPLAPPLTPELAGLLFLSAGFSALGNGLLLMAYRIGTASAIAPMVYFQLLAATGLGWVVFGDLPDALTWAGLAIIIGAGVISARLGRRSFALPTRPGGTERG